MSGQGEEEEDLGPSVDSTDSEERIAARRIRIQRRIEASKREANGQEAVSKKASDSVKDASKSRKQIEDSRQRLVKLKSDGTELVTNVQVAGDAREHSRRVEDDETKRQRVEKLESEAKAAVEKFAQITNRWSYALSREIPQELHARLTEQKNACNTMVDEKNKLIHDLQQELKNLDDYYVKDLKKQAEDVDLMIERMEEQIKTLTKAYSEELLQIEKSFISERSELIDINRKKWQQLMQQRRDKEVEFLDLRRKRVEDYEVQLENLRIQDAEEYNMVKIKLETDVQILEQQLQQMKATYQLNQEKLEYNFQVLKKRDEENTITKSQQKRKITRLQDSLNNLKSKLAKQEKSYKEDNQSLTFDYERITEQYRELQKKFRHFKAADSRKFLEIWLMNENEVKELVNYALDVDRTIHEQQLGLPWQRPQLSFMNSKGPINVNKNDEKRMSATEMARKALESVDSSDEVAATISEETTKQDLTTTKISLNTIKSILELLSDEAGFLVESKLNTLLAPLEKNERSLMKLDAIFAALGIESEDDIYHLARYFIADNTSEEQKSTESLQSKENFDEQSVAASSEIDGIESNQKTESSDDALKEKSDSQKELPRLIDPNDVIRKLRTFVEDNRQATKDPKRQNSKIGTGVERNASLDAEYWQKMTTVVDATKERVWDGLIDGFEKYLAELTQRASLIQETDALTQQNSELRMLLHQYINSKVNQELEIPPTRLLHVENSDK